MDDPSLLAVLSETAQIVRAALSEVVDRRAPGERPGQYGLDLATDAPAVERLVGAGLGVLSEESGVHYANRELCVALDPVDGSTNASRGIPWHCTSMCVVDSAGPRVAHVENLATGTTYTAVRGGGAFRDGVPITTGSCTRIGSAMVGINGYPTRHLGWRQFRALGSAALDLCSVADGTLDGYVDCVDHSHAPWDYLGGMLVVTEAGGTISDSGDEGLVTLAWDARRSPVAAGTPSLHAELLAARRASRPAESS